MEKKLFVFVLLIAFASTQQVLTNQLRVDSTSEGSNNQLQTNGNEKIYPVVTLDGEYTTSITNDPDLRIKFNGEYLTIINGCKTIRVKYSADLNGLIKFGPFFKIKGACLVDFDSLYTTALFNSVLYEIQGDTITLKNSRKAVTMILTKYKPTAQGSPTQ